MPLDQMHSENKPSHPELLAWLARDVVANGPKNGGVDKKYRPRGYDEGPTE